MGWSWPTFWASLSSTGFLHAAWTTVWLTAVVETIALVLAFGLALAAVSHHRSLVVAAGTYTWVWRGTPILIQLLVIYFGLPELGPRPSVIQAGIAGLALNEAAYLGVLLRANILAVGRDQADAGRALGMSRAQRMRIVILPQAMRTFLPTLGNQVNSMIKTTSLVSVISVQELLSYTRNVVSQTYRPYEAFAVATIYYLAISNLWNLIQYGLERRLGRSQLTGRTSDAASMREVSESIVREEVA